MRFEDLVAWQKARGLARHVYAVSAATRFDADRALRDQLRRSVVSVMANIAEGFERRSPRDFAKFLMMAKASNAEALSHLYLARDIRYLEDQQFAQLRAESEELGRVLGALRLGVLRTTKPVAPRPTPFVHSDVQADPVGEPVRGTRNSELGTTQKCL